MQIFLYCIYEDIVLVAALDSEKENIHWSGTSFDKFISDNDIGKWVTVHHTVKLSDIYLNNKNIEFKTYLWNREKRNFLIDDFSICLREGNPVIYGLFSKIKR